MRVYIFNPLEDPRWGDFVQRHPRGSVFHSPNWLEALRRTYGYEPAVYTTSPPTAELTNGVVFCRINSWLTGRRMVSLPFADHCEPLIEKPEDRQEILNLLQRAVKRENWKYIEMRPRSSDILSEPGLEKDGSFCFHVVDLRSPLTDLFQAFQKDSIQRKIRRAEREALCYEEGRSEVLLNKFYRLMLQTRRRHKLPPQPADWFRNLIVCLGERAKIRVASKGGQAIASVLTLSHGATVVYKYGCSDASYHNLGAMPFLFWKAMQEAKEKGFQEFDLGRSDTDNAGLIAFKDHLGATRSMLTYIRISVSRLWIANEGYGMQIARRLFARMPDGLLAAAGKLLYRHIG